MSTLLAVDGDSFAHRAYHALPKSIRLNAVVGFTNMLTRLWQAERPDGVLVAWDTLSVPTYRLHDTTGDVGTGEHPVHV